MSIEAFCSYLFHNWTVTQDNTLAHGGWTDNLFRYLIPGYASDQDQKVSNFFIDYFKDLYVHIDAFDEAKAQRMLDLATLHCANSRQSADLGRLEHYIWASQEKLGLFQNSETRQKAFEQCYASNIKLFERWKGQKFDAEIFWKNPDLVDFIFHSHLHRYINHPYNQHGIANGITQTYCNGRVSWQQEPYLLVNGRQMGWSEIRKKIHIDQAERLYSLQAGEKKYWMYFEEGLTQYDRHHFSAPRPIRQLPCAPKNNQVEIVTTHAHKDDQYFFDRLLKGARHSFLRIIPGEGFSARHPESVMHDGAVYSIGWGIRWLDASFFRPLQTVPGKWFCPDPWEYLKTDLYATPLNATDEQIIQLMQAIQARSQDDYPFNIITGNCCGNTANILRQQGIVDLDTKEHIGLMFYKFIVPKCIRKPINQVASFLGEYTPEPILKSVYIMNDFLQTCLFAPLFSLLGAWRATISYEDEETASNLALTQASNQIKALYSNVYDLFNADKMSFDMTKSVYKWQKKQPSTYFEPRD